MRKLQEVYAQMLYYCPLNILSEQFVYVCKDVCIHIHVYLNFTVQHNLLAGNASYHICGITVANVLISQ